MSLYALAFGASFCIATPYHQLLLHLLATLVIAAFVGINLLGAKEAGASEDLIVGVKLGILILFTGVGIFFVKRSDLLPLLDKNIGGTLMGAALIFVAYEGFQLIPNSVNEMVPPENALPRAIYVTISSMTVLYVLVAMAAGETCRCASWWRVRSTRWPLPRGRPRHAGDIPVRQRPYQPDPHACGIRRDRDRGARVHQGSARYIQERWAPISCVRGAS